MLKTVGFPSTRTGDQTIINGNLVIGTAGKGIDFSADPSAAGMTSELLDDYEEGTFTPVAIGRSSAGTGTYTTQIGSYTKIGNLVYFYIILTWSAHTGTGNLAISGLPFTTFSTNGNNPPLTIQGNNLDFSNTLAATTDRNATTISIQSFASGGAPTDVAMDTAAGVRIEGFYKV